MRISDWSSDVCSSDLFDLDDYLTRQATFLYPADDSAHIKLALNVSQHVYEHLVERPLSDDQTLVRRDDGRCDITATVLEPVVLRWWLLGFSHFVVVVGPALLRRLINSYLQDLL